MIQKNYYFPIDRALVGCSISLLLQEATKPTIPMRRQQVAQTKKTKPTQYVEVVIPLLMFLDRLLRCILSKKIAHRLNYISRL